MSKTRTSQPSRRRLVERFAAHLAFLLDGPTNPVSVSPFLLYRKLVSTLANRRNSYRRGLLGLQEAGDDEDAQRIAERYIDEVIGRRLFLARNLLWHQGHLLFRELCRRSLSPRLQEAELVRAHTLRPSGASASMETADMEARLARQDHSISPRNPASRTREEEGGVCLTAAQAQFALPEELSVWGAIVCGPPKLNRLGSGPALNAFCAQTIKAVEAADAPYGAVMALGLSPFEWGDEISTNTAKKLSTFMAAVADQAMSGLPAWRAAFEKRPVPGFASADELWSSPLGAALRMPSRAGRIQMPIPTHITDGHDHEARFLEAASLSAMLAKALDAGLLSPFDEWLIKRLAQGEALSDLAASAEFAEAMPGASLDDLVEHAENLASRLEEGVRIMLTNDHPDKDGKGGSKP